MIIKKNEYEVTVGTYKARVVEGGKVVTDSNGLNSWDKDHIDDYIEFLQDILLAKKMAEGDTT